MGERAAEKLIGKLFPETRALSVERVHGGYLHRMYAVTVSDGNAVRKYAVKALNPEIMSRPEAAANFAEAEKWERVLEKAGLPIVAAMVFEGRKMQKTDDGFFYVFPWQNGAATDWNAITGAQCRAAGELLGRIHAIDPRRTASAPIERHETDWAALAEETEVKCPEISDALRKNAPLLNAVQRELDEANDSLPELDCVSNEDMDPKNVMWDDDGAHIIDLECLGRGNPVSHAIQLSLQWSGITTCKLNTAHVRAFWEGYRSRFDPGAVDFDRVFGVVYGWVEWLEYNVKRALGSVSRDEEERKMGIGQTLMTINRIRCLNENRAVIVTSLKGE